MGTVQKNFISIRWMVILSLLTMVLSVLFYQPIPEGVLEPWKARGAVGLIRFIGAVAYLGHFTGIGTFIPNMRILVDTLSLIPLKYYDGIQVEDTHFDGTKVRLYIPQTSGTRNPGILFVHGGGWLFCSVETHDRVVAEIARRLNVMIVSVDYRLSPEHPYPVPLQDSQAALLHFISNAEKYGVDPNRIAIVGDSAGGNMAAAMALKLRSMSVPQPKVQALIYPPLQAVDLRTPSYKQNEGAVLGTAAEIAFVLLNYMGVDTSYASVMAQNNHTDGEVKETFYKLVGKHLPEEKTTVNGMNDVLTVGPSAANSELTELIKPYLLDPFCFPLMHDNLTGLPETYIATGEHDLLRDDGFLFAKRLEDAGVKGTLNNYMDGFHGILSFAHYPIRMDVGVRLLDDLILYLAENL